MPNPPSTLEYVSTGAVRPRPPSIDIAMLLLGIGQVSLSAFMCIGYIASAPGGHDELKRFQAARLPAQDVGWIHQLAWALFQLPSGWTLTAWFVASVAMTAGAIALHPPVRRRCYWIGASIVVCAIALMLVALWVLDDSGISSRYVRAAPGSNDAWRTVVIEPSFYWQFPLITLIVNPALVLLAWRAAVRKLADVASHTN